jgi:hypothetical protein
MNRNFLKSTRGIPKKREREIFVIPLRLADFKVRSTALLKNR